MGCQNQERGWSVYKADAASSSYSVLKEINKENVHQLKLAWTFNPDDAAEGSRFAGSQCNPIIIDGIMYVASARHRIYALNAGNGKSYGHSIHLTEDRGRIFSRCYLLGGWK